MVHNRRTRTGLTRNRANASRECLAVSRSPSRLRSSNPFLLHNNQSKTTTQSKAGCILPLKFGNDKRIKRSDRDRRRRALRVEIVHLVPNTFRQTFILNLSQARAIDIPNPGLRDIS